MFHFAAAAPAPAAAAAAAPQPPPTSAASPDLEGSSTYFSKGEVLAASVSGVTDTLSRMQRLCFSRCCCSYTRAAFKEPQLEVYEKACTDRCISKHMQTHELVGLHLARFHSPLSPQTETDASAAAAAQAPAAAAGGTAEKAGDEAATNSYQPLSLAYL